jgi:hypothetical protein
LEARLHARGADFFKERPNPAESGNPPLRSFEKPFQSLMVARARIFLNLDAPNSCERIRSQSGTATSQPHRSGLNSHD